MRGDVAIDTDFFDRWGWPDGVGERREVPSFELGEHEVSVGDWRSVTGRWPRQCGRRFRHGDWCRPALPVVAVTWREAIEFANAASAHASLAPAYAITDRDGDYEVRLDPESDGYRLPSDVEWEFAARAGGRDPFAGAKDLSSLCLSANVTQHPLGVHGSSDSRVPPCDDGFQGPAPVGQFAANPWGLYDMTGNVFEWVWPDGRTVVRGSEEHLTRGGSWLEGRPDYPPVVWSLTRLDRDAYVDQGLRLARSAPGRLP